ncbi:hypothetical protein MPTK1_3g10080 [Marchantia polymorpha subsp. ruderalis]|uniref:Vacuolar protein 8 n=2 Tax=Marchantia polymorpha TaxID=3197 RepID=A0A176WQV6_MARPO|nr:hypothetical protein AXG93_2189s1340 [Marchantia polymorpha subsp. ruderalis]PTQ33796.1 hypothetical protein MARPO_0085s0019 [Marchantia polymorpha]BBN05077.1 hypothetical protein Mp_3g10080 [Marchantia polymorpha subsp. ruderalis]|eukprot:PTQ33796.1 hypothetical protein MARPO_0085s0019 [Marchantia polymorpha]
MAPEEFAVGLVSEATSNLIHYLMEVRFAKQHNKIIVRKIDLIVTTLNSNVLLLKQKLPVKVYGDALGSLTEKLKEATDFVQSRQKQGSFQTMWDDQETEEELESMRQRLVSAYQMAVFITILDVAVDGNRRTNQFQYRMMELSSAYSVDSKAVGREVRELLQPLVMGKRRQDEKLEEVFALVKDLERSDGNEDAERFFNVVLQNIESLTHIQENAMDLVITEDDVDEFYDPITCELMCDPVKGSDGRTYDRWTIIDNDITQSPFDPRNDRPFSILCDDINVRGRLFKKFHATGVETKFRERRQAYRNQAFQLAKDGHEAEALVALENVLKWAYNDKVCQELRDAIAPRIEHQAPKPQKLTSSAHLEKVKQRVQWETLQDHLVRVEEDMTTKGKPIPDQLLESLIRLLPEKVMKSEGVQYDVVRAFALLCQYPANWKKVASYPGALKKLVSLLSREVPRSLLYEAVRAFRSLTGAQDNRMKLASYPGALENLMQLLAEGSGVSENIQVHVIAAFLNLTVAEETGIGIIACPSVLERLVDLLSRDVSASIQSEAAKAFRNLAAEPENMAKMAAYPGALHGLVRLMSREVPVSIQFEAATAFYYLTWSDNNTRVKLLEFPGALERLVGLLSTDVPLRVQSEAAKALQNLSCTPSNISKIVAHPGAFQGLVELLSEVEQVPESVQLPATIALANIVTAEDHYEKLITFPGALETLVRLLSKDVPVSVQTEAVKSLRALSSAPQNLTMIFTHPGTLPGLVTMLSADALEEAQLYAATTFANLALAEKYRAPIVSFPGFLERIVRLLSPEVPAGLQIEASKCLVNVCLENEKNKVKIASFPGALEKLVGLLSIEVPEVQFQGARVYAVLATAEKNKKKLASYPGALKKLEELLAENINDELHFRAQRALTILTTEPEKADKRWWTKLVKS